ncbi:hypothetical protein BUALT_Bualt15G0110000 [Buddleja alternifolia]|uniref:F-box domain-containing protein n=1 Tax=Buddleja alternifolia TaxID=168488 RepID=A0AAV6WJI5_9LAMI|nr:hypothetical protein BUALT_Bualt15G0110000 [Buddleja alternifolia]
MKKRNIFLSDDIVFEILSWLPPKPLLKFRSVSKLWYSTITNSDFIAKHQSHFGNGKSQNNHGGFLAIVVTQKNSLKLRQIPEEQNHHHPGGRGAVVKQQQQQKDKDSLLLCEGGIAADASPFYKIMGSCNGLSCYASLIDNDGHIFLCNPSIRWTRTIPPYSFSTKQENKIYSYGVGFDRFANDYKIIKLSRGATDNAFVSSTTPPPAREAAIYSVKANTWKRVKNAPGPPFSANDMSIFLHGFIHWLQYTTSRYENKKIVLFDVCNEAFGEMQLPEKIDDVMVLPYYTYGLSISVVKGSLCLLVSEMYDGSRVFCHMWIMKEYGVAESWTKQPIIEFKIEIERELPLEVITVSTQATVGGKIMCCIHTNNRKMAYFPMDRFTSNLALFDPQTVEYINLGESHSYRDVVSLVPSLELLDVTM